MRFFFRISNIHFFYEKSFTTQQKQKLHKTKANLHGTKTLLLPIPRKQFMPISTKRQLVEPQISLPIKTKLRHKCNKSKKNAYICNQFPDRCGRA